MIYLILEYPETQTENPLKITQRGSARMKARMGLISWLVLDQSLCFISVKDYALKVIPGRNSMTGSEREFGQPYNQDFLSTLIKARRHGF